MRELIKGTLFEIKYSPANGKTPEKKLVTSVAL